MAETDGATVRLADGLPAVADIETYVLACRALGYTHPDLTAHAGQVRDWYTSEEGLQLSALDADSRALQSVSQMTEDALGRQEEQLRALPAVWQGGGAGAAEEFLRRHGEASTRVAAAVRSAARTLADLRDRLWHAVDGKVATAVAVGERGRREDWRAAAHTVTTGSGDRSTASELVDQQVRPFVDGCVSGEWLTAMREAVAAIEAAYEATTAELAGAPAVTFEVPGELGPSPLVGETVPAGASVAAPGRSAVAPSPAVAPAPPVEAPAAAVPAAAPAEPAGVPPAAASMPSVPSVPSVPSLPMSEFGSALSGFGQQLGDLLGALVESADVGEIDEVEPPDEIEEEEPAEEEGDEEEGDEEDEEEAEPVDEPEPEPEEEEPLEEPVATPAPEPVVVEELAEPPIVEAEPDLEAATPCEIAAGELPQVGE
ncbi:hypothetical protein [Mycolicibacterium phlei]